MGTFTKMAFSPTDGLNDKESYITTPETEEGARAQVQGISDQLKTFINDELIDELENAEELNSGAERMGSAAIDYVSGTTVHTQIVDLKDQIDALSIGSVADGAISTAKLADDAVTQAKIADDAVGLAQIADNAVEAAQIASGAVTAAKYAEGSDDEDKLGTGAVIEAKIGAGAVTETKLGVGAVTSTKVADSAKSDSVAMTSSTVLATATAVKTAYDLAGTKEAALSTDQKRKITISSSSPSGGSDGDIWLEVI